MSSSADRAAVATAEAWFQRHGLPYFVDETRALVADRLSRARHWSDGSPQPISISEVFAYCDGMGLHSVEFRETLLDLVQEMDEEFDLHVAEVRKASDNAAKSDVVGG